VSGIKAKSTVFLSDEHLIGQGTHKKCYVYPENDTLCIKLPYNSFGEIDLKRELKYIKLLQKRGVCCDILPKYHGEIPTNIGRAHVFELIKDYDGKAPQTLGDYLSSPTMLKENFNTLVEELKILKSKMLAHNIITMGLFAINILCKKESEKRFKLVLINDMGSAAFIPLEYYFTFAARARIERKWNGFVEHMEKKYNNPLVKELAKEIR
jgi:hypothetical protein